MENLRRRRRPETPTPTTGAPEAPRLPAAGDARVQVIWGATADSFDLAEMTVNEAYGLLSAPLNIAPAVAALVNGEAADGEHRLASGDVLEFARPAGEKGAGA